MTEPDAFFALLDANQMNRANDTGPRGEGRHTIAEMLRQFVRSDRYDPRADTPVAVATRLFLADGATMTEIADAMQVRGVRSFTRKTTYSRRPSHGRSVIVPTQEAHIAAALLARARCPSRNHIRATHRALHEALVGGPVRGGTGMRGCPWCRGER